MKVIAKNRRANFDYDINKKYVVGIVLSGQEVKSVRTGGTTLKGSYVTVTKDNELNLLNAHIPLYKFATDDNYEPTHSRKLLAKKREIEEIKKLKKEGNTVVPLAIGLQGKYIKLEIGAGRGKKRYDKRHDIKKRDLDRRGD